MAHTRSRSVTRRAPPLYATAALMGASARCGNDTAPRPPSPRQESVTVVGIKDRAILVLDQHPAFAEVRSAILNAGFVAWEGGSYVLLPCAKER